MAFATDADYFGVNSLEAKRTLQKITTSDPQTMSSDLEREKWARAMLAFVSLDRLTGEDQEALEILRRCGKWCEKYGAAGEWHAASAWACAKKKETSFCLPERQRPKSPRVNN